MIADLIARVEQIEAEYPDPLYKAWVLVANSVFGNAAEHTPIALFDSSADAERYSEQCRYVYPHHPIDGYYRSFRPDSLLFDYNSNTEVIELGLEYAIRLQSLHMRHLPHNPIAPTGDFSQEFRAKIAAAVLT